MKHNWFPVFLGIIIAWVIVAEIINNSSLQKKKEERFTAIEASAARDSAWIAAFMNCQPRPHIDQIADWPILSKKPYDSPLGPYADSFSQKQHKYGPFQPIANAKTVTK